MATLMMLEYTLRLWTNTGEGCVVPQLSLLLQLCRLLTSPPQIPLQVGPCIIHHSPKSEFQDISFGYPPQYSAHHLLHCLHRKLIKTWNFSHANNEYQDDACYMDWDNNFLLSSAESSWYNLWILVTPLSQIRL